VTTELLDEAPDDPETVVISWLAPNLAAGHVANTRKSGDPLPFYLVSHLDSNESIEESTSDALVSVHVLTHKSAGEVASRDEADRMHRRMLQLARYLENVDLTGGRMASIESVSVAKSPAREPYGDELILRRVGRYNLGLSYAKVQ
jgi:hypothetical protein